jgi:hypothetical protein
MTRTTVALDSLVAVASLVACSETSGTSDAITAELDAPVADWTGPECVDIG